MPYLPVDIYLLNQSAGNAPLTGVLVRLLDRTGRLIYTQASTDSLGVAHFLLPTELSPYQVRCYKQAVAFSSPVSIDVVGAAANQFNVYGCTIAPPVSQDPRICVAYGYFRDGTNSPFAGCTLHFIPTFDPLIIDGSAVLKERTLARSDEDGYLAIGLIRCAKYDVLIEGMEDQNRTIYVPDRLNVNLPDLLFPVVDHADMPAWNGRLAIGEEQIIVPVVWSSSGLQLCGTARRDVRWSSSDPTVFACTVQPDQLILRGMSSGVAQLQGVRYDNSIIRIPNTTIGGQPITVTVS
jgi:hypothetical protein